MSGSRFSHPPVGPEDDWFAEPVETAPGRAEEQHVPSGRAEPQHVQRPPGGRDKRIVAAALAGALILLTAGVLVARAFTGADGEGETTTITTTTTTTVAPETTPTTTTTTTPTTTTPTTTTPTTTTPTTLPEETVRPGDESEAVSQVQTALVELGYSTGGVDGKFGPATERAVREFQESSGLEVDGVVGPATLAALSAALDDA